MTPTTAIGVIGALVVAFIAAVGFFGKWFLRSIDKKDVLLEKGQKEREAMVTGFLDATNDFTMVVENAMKHQQDSLDNLSRAIERLCDKI